MTLDKLLSITDFNNSFIFGWYGGGNFGDELLLATLLELLNSKNYKDLKYLYLDNNIKGLLEQKYLYAESVESKSKILKTILSSRNIIVGGGGHWGQDMNNRVFFMTILLFISHFIFRKKVFLLGVGFYNSTNRLGRISAWLAAKSSRIILARDNESYTNFNKFNKKGTYLDKDIAFSLESLLSKLESFTIEKIKDVIKLESIKKPILICVRHMKSNRGDSYNNAIADLIDSNKDKKFILMSMEPREKFEQNYSLIEKLKGTKDNVNISDFRFNPLAFVKYLKSNSKSTLLIAPQYHVQLIAHLVGIKHFPIVYDNKVKELLTSFGVNETFNMDNIKSEDLQRFINANY